MASNKEQVNDEKGALGPEVAQEESGVINVGGCEPLAVPREDIGAGIDPGTGLDVTALQDVKIKKPYRRDWIMLHRSSEMTTHLVVHKPNPNSMDTEHYFVAPDLRLRIAQELKAVRVFLYYAINANEFGLWAVNVTPDGSWYNSLGAMLKKDKAFFQSHALRIIPDKSLSRYTVRIKEVQLDVPWLDRSMGQLLAEAIGEDHFITSPDHEVYADLVAGEELK